MENLNRSYLESDRLRLRAPEPEDVDCLLAWENDPGVWLLSGSLAPFSRRQICDFVAEGTDIYESKQMRLMIDRKLSPPHSIGTLDLFEFDPFHQRAGVGILIGDLAFRRQGLAFEALTLLADYAFSYLGLHQLHAEIPAGNEPSLRLFRQAGYEPAGIRRQWLRTDRQWVDVHLFQLFHEHP